MTQKIETFDELIQNIENIKKNFESIRSLEMQTLEIEVEVLTTIFNKIKRVLPFIHNKIVTFDDEYYDRNNWVGDKAFYPERGVLVADTSNSKCLGRYEHKRVGNRVYLFDDLKIIDFQVEGAYSQYQYTPQSFELTCEEEVTTEELVKRYGFETVISNLIKEFNYAIEHNKNKRIQLQSRLDTLEQIKELLSERK